MDPAQQMALAQRAQQILASGQFGFGRGAGAVRMANNLAADQIARQGPSQPVAGGINSVDQARAKALGLLDNWTNFYNGPQAQQLAQQIMARASGADQPYDRQTVNRIAGVGADASASGLAQQEELIRQTMAANGMSGGGMGAQLRARRAHGENVRGSRRDAELKAQDANFGARVQGQGQQQSYLGQQAANLGAATNKYVDTLGGMEATWDAGSRSGGGGGGGGSSGGGGRFGTRMGLGINGMKQGATGPRDYGPSIGQVGGMIGKTADKTRLSQQQIASIMSQLTGGAGTAAQAGQAQQVQQARPGTGSVGGYQGDPLNGYGVFNNYGRSAPDAMSMSPYGSAPLNGYGMFNNTQGNYNLTGLVPYTPGGTQGGTSPAYPYGGYGQASPLPGGIGAWIPPGQPGYQAPAAPGSVGTNPPPGPVSYPPGGAPNDGGVIYNPTAAANGWSYGG